MADPDLIGRIARATPSRTTSWRSHRRVLPDDLLRDASRRLGIMSLVAGGLWIVASVLGHLAAQSMVHGDARLGVGDAIAVVSVAVSLLLFFYTRRGDQDPRRLLDLGLALHGFHGLRTGTDLPLEPDAGGRSIAPEISWIGAVVLMFAAIVPSTPGKTLAAGLVAVSMNPVAMLIARARGTWDFDPSDALLMHYPDYLLVGVAVVISHVVTSLGQQVAKAREMGSYQLGELLGRGGMGEVYRATHRMLARPAAIKLIRPEMIGASDAGGRAGRGDAFPARSGGGGQPALAAHRRALRLRRHGRRDALLRDGAARRHGSRIARSSTRASARRPRGAHPPPGVRVARRGARARSRAPGHQAGQHPRRPARARRRLRQGARLRPRETDRRREPRAGADDAGRA